MDNEIQLISDACSVQRDAEDAATPECVAIA